MNPVVEYLQALADFQRASWRLYWATLAAAAAMTHPTANQLRPYPHDTGRVVGVRESPFGEHQVITVDFVR